MAARALPLAALVLDGLVAQLAAGRLDAATAQGALELAEQLVAAAGHEALTAGTAWVSSRDVTTMTGIPVRTVRRRMASGLWPSATRASGRWIVRAGDVLGAVPARPTPIRDDLVPASSRRSEALDRALLVALERDGATTLTPRERAAVVERFRRLRVMTSGAGGVGR